MEVSELNDLEGLRRIASDCESSRTQTGSVVYSIVASEASPFLFWAKSVNQQ